MKHVDIIDIIQCDLHFPKVLLSPITEKLWVIVSVIIPQVGVKYYPCPLNVITIIENHPIYPRERNTARTGLKLQKKKKRVLSGLKGKASLFM